MGKRSTPGRRGTSATRRRHRSVELILPVRERRKERQERRRFPRVRGEVAVNGRPNVEVDIRRAGLPISMPPWAAWHSDSSRGLVGVPPGLAISRPVCWIALLLLAPVVIPFTGVPLHDLRAADPPGEASVAAHLVFRPPDSALTGALRFSVVGDVAVGSSPEEVAVDPRVQEVYVANSGSDNVSVLSIVSGRLVATVPLSASPFGVAYDSGNSEVYVTDGMDVSAISDTTHQVLKTTSLSDAVRGITYDAGQGELFVAGVGNNALSTTEVYVISDTNDSVTASINLSGSQLYDVAYDPARGAIFVANFYDGSVEVISDSSDKVTATLTGLGGPRGVAYGNGTGVVVAADWSSNKISMILDSNDTVNHTLAVGSLPRGVAYDPQQTEWFVTNQGSNNISVISRVTSTVVATLPAGVSPRGIAYSESTGELFVANSGSDNVSILSVGAGQPSYRVRFTEIGLPASTYWTLHLGGLTLSNNSSSLSLLAPNGTYSWRVFSADPRYQAAPVEGTLLVSGGAQEVNISFGLVTYILNATEAGLPPGGEWFLNVSGGGADWSQASRTTWLELPIPNGTYAYQVSTPDKRFQADSSNGTFEVRGGAVFEQFTFSQLRYVITFFETGLPSGTDWGVSIGGTVMSSAGPTLMMMEPNGTYPYSISLAPGYSTSYRGQVTVDGGPISQSIRFAQVTYIVTFQESGLTPGTNWSVVLNGVTDSSSGSTIIFSEPNGSYAFTVRATSGYSPNITSGVVQVTGEAVNRPFFFVHPPSNIGPNATSSAGGFLGLPGETGYLLVVGISALIAAVVALMMRNRSRDRGRDGTGRFRRGRRRPPNADSPATDPTWCESGR